MLKIRLLVRYSVLQSQLARCSTVAAPVGRKQATGNYPERSFRRKPGHSGGVEGVKRQDADFPRDERPIKSVRLRRRTTFPVEMRPQDDRADQGWSAGGEEGGEEGDGDKPKKREKSLYSIRVERFNRQVQNLVRRGKVAEAAEVLERMNKSKMRPDVVTYNNIILGYSRVGEFKKAFKLFNELKKRALLPTDYTYSSMFAACGAAGSTAASSVLNKVRSEMERRDVPLNTITANALMSALASCGHHTEAIQVYMDMDKKDIKPDVFTFGGLLTIMAKDKTKGVGMAKGVWSEMAKSAIVPDLHCHNIVLQVLRDGGMEGVVKEVEHNPDKPPKSLKLPTILPDELKSLVREVKMGKFQMKKKSTDSVDNVKKLRGVVLKKKNVEEKEETELKDLKDIGKDEVAVEDSDVAEYRSTRQRVWLKDLPEASEIYLKGELTFHLSKAHRLVLKVGSDRLRDTQGRVRWLEKSSQEAFFAFMKKNRVKPDIRTFQLLGHLTTDHGHLLVTMRERKVMPDVKFMVALITQHAKYFRNLRGALALMEYSKGAGLNLGVAGYQALMAGCTQEKEALYVLDMMKADGMEPDHQMMGTLVGHAVRDHSYKFLTSMVREMMHLEMKPNNVIIEMMETAAARQPKSERQKDRLNGFKGFYKIWKDKVVPKEKEEEEFVVV